MDRSQRLRDGTRWRTFMRLLRLDDLMTSYTHGRHIAIPEKSVFRLISSRGVASHMTVRVHRRLYRFLLIVPGMWLGSKTFPFMAITGILQSLAI